MSKLLYGGNASPPRCFKGGASAKIPPRTRRKGLLCTYGFYHFVIPAKAGIQFFYVEN